MIGHAAELFEISGGFIIKIEGEPFKLDADKPLETRLNKLESTIKALNERINQNDNQNGAKQEWARRDSNSRSSPCEGDVIAN